MLKDIFILSKHSQTIILNLLEVENVDNQEGIIEGGSVLMIKGKKVDNRKGILFSESGLITLTAIAPGMISGESISKNMMVQNEEGKIWGNGVYGDEINNSSGVIHGESVVRLKRSINERGIIESAAWITLGDENNQEGRYNNKGGYIGAYGDEGYVGITVKYGLDQTTSSNIVANGWLQLNISEGGYENAGEVRAAGGLGISALWVNNTGSIYTRKGLSLVSKGVVTNDGVLGSLGLIEIRASGDVWNKKTIWGNTGIEIESELKIVNEGAMHSELPLP